MPEFAAATYGPVFAPLLETDRNRPLDSGIPVEIERSRLEACDIDIAFAHATVEDLPAAVACVAGVWLLADFLDESHTISQGVQTTDGSFWHGIMHRREGDFSNAKYWFRNVGEHAIFGDMLSAASVFASSFDRPIAKNILQWPAWDPYAFIDLCQSAVEDCNDDAALLRLIQRAEWELLFDHCYRKAIG